MTNEKDKMETKIQNDKLEKMRADYIELPSLEKRTREEALEEILTDANTVKNPVFVADYFEAESGVTLIEGGRTKTNQSRRIYKFETTGSLRMNKTQYSTK